MLCKQCGFNLSNQANFCPGCGKKVTEEERLENASPRQSTLWLKLLLGLLLLGVASIVLVILLSGDLTDTVSDQLQTIKEGKLTEAYYNYTSKAFQEATSLSNFREFMNVYPVFSHHRSVRFIDRNTDNDSGFLHAMILTEKGMEIPVQYRLVKEQDKWKIDSIKLEDMGAANSSKIKEDQTLLKPLEATIKEQMKQIRLKNLKKAYEEYTSIEFQKTTTFNEFEEFIQDNPSFSENQSVELDDLSFNNNVATLAGILKTADGKVYPVEYDLVDEKGVWKIFHVQVLNSDQRTREAILNLKFSKFVLGSDLGDDGLVVSSTTVFKKGAGDIYLNLYVDHAKADTKIQVLFEHIDSHSSIEPISTRVSEEGNAILTFIFSPPPSGWPVGQYRLLVTASTGEHAQYDFKVES